VCAAIIVDTCRWHGGAHGLSHCGPLQAVVAMAERNVAHKQALQMSLERDDAIAARARAEGELAKARAALEELPVVTGQLGITQGELESTSQVCWVCPHDDTAVCTRNTHTKHAHAARREVWAPVLW